MSRKILRFTRFAVVLMALMLCATMLVSAAPIDEDTYTYNSYKQSVPVPDLYEAVEFMDCADLECGTLDSPEDMYMHESGLLYIADADNGRIVVLDKDLNFVKTMSEFYDPELGETTYLSEPGGVFVDEQNRIYISDPGYSGYTEDDEALNGRIIRCDQEGNIDRIYYAPDVNQFDDETYFEPTRLLVDRQGNLYTLCRNIYHGIALFNADGEFESFFGAESVYASAEVRLQQWWKSIMSDEAAEGMERYVPTEMKCIDLDDEGYLYTIAQSHSTLGTKNEMDSIRKLNAKGADIIVQKMPTISFNAFKLAAVRLNMTDLTVDEDGYIYVIDGTAGKLLQFDKEMNLLGMTGSIGYSLGQFQTPNAIENYGDRLYVLDKLTNLITVLERTEFGDAVHTAVSAYHEGYYDQTIEPWEKVISLSNNYEFAYTCLGNAYLNKGDYEKALECYELGRDSTGYNEAYKQIRKDVIREALPYVVIAVAVLVVVLVVVSIIRKTKKGR